MDSAGHVGPGAKYTHFSGNGLLWKKRAGAIASLAPHPEEQLPCQMGGWKEREKDLSIYTMDCVISTIYCRYP